MPLTIPANSPYRYLNPKVDGPAAYPESTLFKLHEAEISACRKLVRYLEDTDVKMCRYEGDLDARIYEGEDDNDGFFTTIERYYPNSKNDIERQIFAAFGVDYDGYQYELGMMLHLWNGIDPRPEPEEPLTGDEADALARKINEEGRYGWNQHTHHLYRVFSVEDTDDGSSVILVHGWAKEDPDHITVTGEIATARDYRRFLARLAAEVIYK